MMNRRSCASLQTSYVVLTLPTASSNAAVVLQDHTQAEQRVGLVRHEMPQEPLVGPQDVGDRANKRTRCSPSPCQEARGEDCLTV